MINGISINNIINSIIPISRFNKGEANRIFDEVKISGCKIVIKNNIPACVLISPEQYQEMLDAIEDTELFNIAEARMVDKDNQSFVSGEEVYNTAEKRIKTGW